MGSVYHIARRIDWIETDAKVLHWNPNPPGVAHSNSLLTLGLYPVFVSLPEKRHHKLAPSLWQGLAEQHKAKSLRCLAKEYGVSHEAVRRALVAQASKE
jgi:hypothetical protein